MSCVDMYNVQLQDHASPGSSTKRNEWKGSEYGFLHPWRVGQLTVTATSRVPYCSEDEQSQLVNEVAYPAVH